MSLSSRLNIGPKLVIAVGAAALAGIVSSGLILNAAVSYRRAETTNLAAARQAEIAIREASGASKEMAAETLAFLLTADKVHENAKYAADERASERFERTKQLCASLPNAGKVLALLDEAHELDEKTCNPLENQLLNLAKEGKGKKSIALYEDVYSEKRRELEDKISASVHLIGQGVAIADEAANSHVTRSIWAGIGLAIALFAFAFATAIGIGRNIIRSVRGLALGLKNLQSGSICSLSEALRRLAGGDLTVSANSTHEQLEVRSSDEVGQMLQTFNAMSDEVGTAIAAFNGARESLVGLVSQLADILSPFPT